jgi:sulfate permease, SulP family
MLPPLPLEKPTLLHRFFPATEWVPGYERAYISGDLLAALTVWALLIPEALAYAGVAGVPIQYGLYTAPLALLAYAVFGGGRRLIVGPTSTVAIVSASVVAPLAASGGQDRYIALTIALALMVGVVLVVAGLARMGFVAKFLAKPVLDGFIIGMAFTIAIGQAGKVVGVSTSGDTALQKTVSIFSQAGDWYWLPIVIGLGCLALLIVLDKTVPWLPGALLVVIVTTLLAYVLHLGQHGLSLVGSSPAGLPSWMLKGLSLEDLYHLLPGALAVALVAFSESIAVAKDDAIRNDYEIDASQEMIANGMANLGSGLLQGFAVNGSLSKSAACETAGGKTQMTSVITAVLAFLTMLFLTGLFKYLPEATLGAIVIHALMKYFKWDGLVRLYRVRKPDFVLSAAALLGVLLFGILPGLIMGVVLSLALLIQRAGSPNSAVLGREPGGNLYADITNHPSYETVPGLIVYRFDAPLVFPNAERFTGEIRDLVKYTEPAAREVLLDAETVSDMDTTAADQLEDLIESLGRQGVSLAIARLHAPVKDFMRRDGLLDVVGEENVYSRVMDAVAAFESNA